jgi:hypothetical protein
MQNLSQSTWDDEILYADRSSMNKQLLVIYHFRKKTKNTNITGDWAFKYIFYFMEKAHEPFQLDIWISVNWNIMDTPSSFVWSFISLDGGFECGDVT